MFVGKKQDLWYVVDLLTGEKQQTLTSSFAEVLCPSSSLLYLGRTGNYPITLLLLSGSSSSSKHTPAPAASKATLPLLLSRVHHHHVRHKEQGAALECHLFRLCLHTSRR